MVEPNTIQKEFEQFPRSRDSLLPILHAVQAKHGWIDPCYVVWIADYLNLSKADVHGVLHFYDDFRTEPAGKQIVRICVAESCQAMGSEQLSSYLKEKLRLDFHQTAEEAGFTLEPVYCLGNCACSPSVQINDQVFGRITNEKLDRLLS